MSDESKTEQILTFRCPFCGKPLWDAGLGELEAEIERREHVVSIEVGDLQTTPRGVPGFPIHIRSGQREDEMNV